jgi:hypothetical protein
MNQALYAPMNNKRKMKKKNLKKKLSSLAIMCVGWYEGCSWERGKRENTPNQSCCPGTLL